MRNICPSLLVLSLATACAPATDEVPEDRADVEPQAFPGRSGPTATARVEGPQGSYDVTYEIIDGWAVAGGDMILGRADAVGADVHGQGAGRSATTYRWPNGVVPYEIDPNMPATWRNQAQEGIDYWNAYTPYWLVQRTGQTDYIRFESNTGCSSPIGRQGGKQVISLNGCIKGTGIHEIGHSLGLFHEMQRSDRDQNILVYWSNIQPDKRSQFQTWAELGTNGQDLWGFDFDSIMLYGNYSYAIDKNEPTMLKMDGTLWTKNLGHLSSLDIASAFRILSKSASTSTFRLKNAYTGQCLEADAARTNGSQIWQDDCGYWANQYWYFWTVPGTGNVAVVNAYTGMCLDVPGGQAQLEGPVNQYDCHARANQQWTIASTPWGTRLQNASSRTCLLEYLTSDLAGLEQYACGQYTDESWVMVY
jgi:hypothetical protein